MLVISDRVKESSITEGSGSVSLDSPFGSFQSFSEGIGNGNTTYYCIENGVRWEVGQGVYSTAGNLLSRDTVFDSSASGTKINLEGVSVVFCTLPASKAVIENTADHTYVDGISTLELNASGISSESINNSGQATFGEKVLVSGNLELLGEFEFTGDLANINGITTSGDIVSSGLLTLVRPLGDEGNFFHAYKDDGTSQPVALHMNGSASPLWKLGLKTNPNSETDPPTFAYVFARDGSIGLVSNASNYASISDDIGFTVQNVAHNVLRVSSLTGVYLETNSSANPSFVITGPPLNAEDLTRWSQADDTILSVVDSGGKIGILMDTPIYELDVNGSGRMDTLKTSGIYFQDGTFQSSASAGGGSNATHTGDVTGSGALTLDPVAISGQTAEVTYDPADQVLIYDDAASGLRRMTLANLTGSVSGWADITMTNRDNAVSGWAASTISAGDAAISGWASGTISAGDSAVSGYFQTYVDSQDHSALQVSGWASSTIVAGDNAVSGWADSTITTRDANVSGYASTTIANGDASISGFAATTISNGDLAVSGFAAITIANADSAISGWADSTMTTRDAAISGFAATTITNGDAAISGFAATTISNGDSAVSGWADSTMTTRDAAISGWASGTIVAGDLAVSGWAAATFTGGGGGSFNDFDITDSGGVARQVDDGETIKFISGTEVTFQVTSDGSTHSVSGAIINSSGYAISVSGWADTTMTSRDNAVSGFAATTLANGDLAVSGWADTHIGSVSGWADTTMTSRDNAVSGFAATTLANGDLAVSGWADTHIGSVSGWADTTMTNRDNAVSGWASTAIANGDAAISGFAATTIANGDAAISGFAATTIANGDTAVSGWAATTITNGDAAISGFAATTITNGDTAVSGFAATTIANGDAAVSGWAAATFGVGDVSKVGTPVDNQIGIWTGDGTIEGDTDLTWDDAEFGVTGRVALTKALKTPIDTETDGATITFDCNESNLFTVVLGGDRTLALSNVGTGQRFIIRLVQDGTGTRLATWFSTIKWPGSLAPTLTATINKTDVFGFICTGSNTYDGYVIGYNL